MRKNCPEDLKVIDDKLWGIYRGVVEDNDDPEKAGRCKIRIWGLHTSVKQKTDIEGIPTDELPWSEPAHPIMEGSISGFGIWSVPLQGSHVLIFFENGNYFQPRYFASMPAVPENSPDTSLGFNDPDGIYPTNSNTYPDQLLSQPDVHRLARGLKTDTAIELIEDSLDLNVPTALGGTWDEPNPSYNTTYPHNFVISTHGGLIMELDSTPGAERFHLYHPSHTYIEITVDGDVIVRNERDKFEVVMQNKYSHIKGNKYTTVNGNVKDYTKGNVEVDIDGSKTEEITSNWTLTVNGDIDWTVAGDIDITATGNITLNATRIDLNP